MRAMTKAALSFLNREQLEHLALTGEFKDYLANRGALPGVDYDPPV
jgi:hypothetical protein